jgi:rubrerythrin
MAKTDENIAAAFAGESQANRKYLAFAKKADEEGHKQIARLFRAAAAAETVHAHNHLRAMGGIKSTADNLRAAIEGEHYEFTKMYPGFIKAAQAEKKREAQGSFALANKVEEIHHRLYTASLEALKAGKSIPAADYYVCQICGNTVENAPPETCPVCGAPRSNFQKIE